MTADRIAIVGSLAYPTPADVVAFVRALPAGAVAVTDDRSVVGGIVCAAAGAAGLAVTVHAPNRQRDGDAASFRQAEAIVADCTRLVAFAAHDPGTRRITEGTALRIRLAEKKGVPVEVIETPVPGRVCVLIARLRHRYEGIRTAATPGYAAYRVRSAGTLLAELVAVRGEFDRRLADGWDEVDAEPDQAAREAMTDAWCGVLLPTYCTVSDVIAEATAVLAGAPSPSGPSHRRSLHRGDDTGALACVA